MKKVITLAAALCTLFTSCKKDKQSDYYKAVALQGGNHCDKGTWIQLDQQVPVSVSSSVYSNMFNAVNLPDADNVPGKTINVKFTYDQSGTVCTAMWQSYQNVILTDIK